MFETINQPSCFCANRNSVKSYAIEGDRLVTDVMVKPIGFHIVGSMGVTGIIAKE